MPEKIVVITRREFIKTTGTGALAAGIAPSFGFSERIEAMQSERKPIRRWLLMRTELCLMCTR